MPMLQLLNVAIHDYSKTCVYSCKHILKDTILLCSDNIYIHESTILVVL